MKENALREQIATLGKSLYDRGLAHGSAGNISVRLADGWLMTPTNSCLGRLDPARISRLDASGKLISSDKPSTETFLHLAMYQERPVSSVVVHLHATHAVAASCLCGLDPGDIFPPVTAYAIVSQAIPSVLQLIQHRGDQHVGARSAHYHVPRSPQWDPGLRGNPSAGTDAGRIPRSRRFAGRFPCGFSKRFA
jgi:ribulose-5-phosphate 4-epimerase/fuculose-1-phosphate aldolase